MKRSVAICRWILFMTALSVPIQAYGQRTGPAEAGPTPGLSTLSVPAAWAGQDPGDSLYRGAREALNRSQFQEAVRLFAQLRSEFPTSEYVADAYYYQAFAHYRMGSRQQLRDARRLLVEQAERHPEAATREDADALRLR